MIVVPAIVVAVMIMVPAMIVFKSTVISLPVTGKELLSVMMRSHPPGTGVWWS